MVLDYIKANAAPSTVTVMELSDMFLQSVISDIMIQSHVHEVFVQHLEQALMQRAVDSTPAGTNVDGKAK